MDQHAATSAVHGRQPSRAPNGTASGCYRTSCDENATRGQGFSHTAAAVGTGNLIGLPLKSPATCYPLLQGRRLRDGGGEHKKSRAARVAIPRLPSSYSLLGVFPGETDIVLRRAMQPTD